MSMNKECKKRFKFNPANYIQDSWMRTLDHWANPFGNYHEPLPFPEKRMNEAVEKGHLTPASQWLYWHWRNFLHNFTHFTIGIVPVGKRYEWISPECNGWRRVKGSWYSVWLKRYRIPLPYAFGNIASFEWAIGWKSDGCWGVNFRRKQN